MNPVITDLPEPLFDMVSTDLTLTLESVSRPGQARSQGGGPMQTDAGQTPVRALAAAAHEWPTAVFNLLRSCSRSTSENGRIHRLRV